ncbi:unnamed protein product [Lymnaea stagnalis]|uniref:Uncharacterized protein n=1 Tax=Lymnaea stagnalis TaxID=6523 RepID=A0AAV2HXQ3_LYMST
MSSSKLLALLLACQLCGLVLCGAAITEEAELSEKEIDEAVVTEVERALDTLDALFKGEKRAPNLYRRGWLSDTWGNFKNSAKQFWDQNKQQIISTGISWFFGRKRDALDSYLALRRSAVESLVQARDVGSMTRSTDGAKRSLDIISNFLTAVDSA